MRQERICHHKFCLFKFNVYLFLFIQRDTVFNSEFKSATMLSILLLCKKVLCHLHMKLILLLDWNSECHLSKSKRVTGQEQILGEYHMNCHCKRNIRYFRKQVVSCMMNNTETILRVLYRVSFISNLCSKILGDMA